MNKFIKNNQKKILAVFGVMLMVVFIIPPAMKSGSGGDDLLLGQVGGKKIHGSDEAQAKDDLRVLRQAGFRPLLLLGADQRNQNAPGIAFAELEQSPLTYALLQEEARQNGVEVSDAQVTRAVEDGLMMSADPAAQARVRPAVERFLLVYNNYQRAAGAIKVSSPQLRHEQATQFQQVRFNVVELSAARYADKVPAPTPEQIRRRYDQYADRAPGTTGFPATQPATPGYLVPDRYKVQYLELPGDAVADAFLNGMDNKDRWPLQLAAYGYYTSHATEFLSAPEPTTLPATQPTTGPTTAPGGEAATQPVTAPATPPATGPATRVAASQPTTRPYAEVERDVLRRLLTGAAGVDAPTKAVKDLRDRFTAYSGKLQNDLRDRLAKDYAAFTAGGPTTGPAVDAPYDSVQYLEKVVDAFQAQYAVRPVVTSLGTDWKTVQDMRGLPKIGFASAGDVSFAQAVTRSFRRPASAPATGAATAPVTAPATGPASQPGAGNLYEPSVVFQDSDHNAFVFRVFAFEAEHRPNLADVEPAIIKELKNEAAYETAKAEAKALLARAQASAEARDPNSRGGLPAAGPALTVGPVPVGELAQLATLTQSGATIPPQLQFQLALGPGLPGYSPLDPGAKLAFITQLAPLPAKATAKEPHPAALIDLPTEYKVVVAEVGPFELRWTQERAYEADTAIRGITLRDAESQFAADWFAPDGVASRVNYQPTERASKSKS